MAASQATDPTSKTEPRTFATAIHKARAPAWDPHEVWLTRVKQPRDLKRWVSRRATLTLSRSGEGD